MPVATTAKISALRRDFKTGAALADLLGVNRSQVTRWLRGAGIDPLNADKIDLLELVWSSARRLYAPEAARTWLFGLNPHLGDRRPIDLVRAGRAEVLLAQVLVRRWLPLVLATIELAGRPRIVDLDEPSVLAGNALRPSRVATRRRDLTPPQALGLYRRGGAGIRWWSTFESLWTNLTVFDRGVDRLRVGEVRRLRIDDPTVREAADLLGIAPA